MFRPMWIMMGIVGMVPVSWTSPYKLSVHPWRSSVLYALAVYLLVMYQCVWSFVLERLPSLDPRNSSANLDDRLYSLLFLVHLIAMLYIPVLWVDCARSERKFLAVDAYLVEHGRVLGRPLCMRRLRRVTLITASFCVVMLPCVASMLTLIPNQNFLVLRYVPAYVYAAYGQFVCSSSRVLLSYMLQCTARDLAGHLAHLEEGPAPSARTEDLLRRGRGLWMQLRQVYFRSGSTYAVELCMGINVLLMITLAMYLFITFIAAGAFNHAGIQLVVMGVYSTELLLVCIFSQKAMEEIKDPFIRVLDRLACSPHRQVRDEVKLFLAAMAGNPACLRLARFTNIDRRLFFQVLSAILTYIVVLAQFKSSGEQAVRSTATPM